MYCDDSGVGEHKDFPPLRLIPFLEYMENIGTVLILS